MTEMLEGSLVQKAPQLERRSHAQKLLSFLDERAILYALAIGFALRLATALANWQYPNSEAEAVAIALANGRGFADTWYPGQGPTAHLMPGGSLLTALTYAVFGQGTLGELVRIMFAFCVTTGCYALAALCCALAGAKPSACKAAFIFLLVVPIHNFTESVRWQDWEGGMATFSGLATLALLLASERGHRYPAERLLRGVMPAITFLINPIIGLAAGIATAIFIYRQRQRIGFLRPMLTAMACAVLVSSPWVIRNQTVFGVSILTRSNLGLELAVANYPAAVSFSKPMEVFHARIVEIHPHENPKIQQQLEEVGGEIAYNERLLETTIAWIKEHPNGAMTIWIRHLREILFPPTYLFKMGKEDLAAGWRAAIASTLSILAFASLVIAGIKRDRNYLYLAAFVTVPVLAGLPFQTVPRYIWPIYPILCCLAFDLISRIRMNRYSRSLGPSGRTHRELFPLRSAVSPKLVHQVRRQPASDFSRPDAVSSS